MFSNGITTKVGDDPKEVEFVFLDGEGNARAICVAFVGALRDLNKEPVEIRGVRSTKEVATPYLHSLYQSCSGLNYDTDGIYHEEHEDTDSGSDGSLKMSAKLAERLLAIAVNQPESGTHQSAIEALRQLAGVPA